MNFFDLFYFTRSQRNGIIILLILIITVWVAYFTIDRYYSFLPVNYNNFEKLIDSSIITEQNFKLTKTNGIDSIKKFNKDTCKVNVNKPDYIKLLCIGLNEKIAKIWINYVQKGGKFFSLEDVKKLWQMTDSIYNSIYPYLYLENNIKNNTGAFDNKSKRLYHKKEEINLIELNTADSATLVNLPGIGPVFAKRIIKYRNLLGGFYKSDQLKEVYGFTEEMFSKIKGMIYTDVFEIKRININNADFKSLISHPYLRDKNLVIGILNLRKKIGKYKNVSDLITYNITDSSTFEKIKWYLECK